jgi:hypothetical protein
VSGAAMTPCSGNYWFRCCEMVTLCLVSAYPYIFAANPTAAGDEGQEVFWQHRASASKSSSHKDLCKALTFCLEACSSLYLAVIRHIHVPHIRATALHTETPTPRKRGYACESLCNLSVPVRCHVTRLPFRTSICWGGVVRQVPALI